MTSRLVLLGALLLVACSGSEAGITLGVSLGAGGKPGATTLTLAHVYVGVESVELLRCDSTASRLLRWLSPIDTAWAHEEGATSPTRTSAPGVIDLVTRTPLALGELHPPAGDYCSVRVVFGPPDDDALGLPGPEFVGQTLVLDATSGSDPVHLATTGSRSVTIALKRLTLDADTTNGTLYITIGGDGWLGELDPESATAAEDLLARIASGSSASTGFTR
jgi:hypothetical protein